MTMMGDELDIALENLRKMAIKHGYEYQFVAGKEGEQSWQSSYEGEGKRINQLCVSALGYIFLAPKIYTKQKTINPSEKP